MPPSQTPTWADLLQKLALGRYCTWSAAKGDLNNWFEVVEIRPDRILVTSPGIKGKPRHVRQVPFEKVAKVWPRYSSGNLQRRELVEITRNLTYIITLMNWLEKGQHAAP